MNWFKQFRDRLDGVNSKPRAPAEQSEWTTKTVRSVEVTVQTEEFILYEVVRAKTVVPEARDNWQQSEPPAVAGG